MLRREVYKRGEPYQRPLIDEARAWALLALALAGAFYAVALSFVAACNAVELEIKGAGADIAEVSYCEVESCGEVFLCTMPDGAKNEWCWMDDSSAELASASGALSCVSTPRGGALGWPCLYCCGSKCGRGANAYMGSFCP